MSARWSFPRISSYSENKITWSFCATAGNATWDVPQCPAVAVAGTVPSCCCSYHHMFLLGMEFGNEAGRSLSLLQKLCVCVSSLPRSRRMLLSGNSAPRRSKERERWRSSTPFAHSTFSLEKDSTVCFMAFNLQKHKVGEWHTVLDAPVQFSLFSQDYIFNLGERDGKFAQPRPPGGQRTSWQSVARPC